MKVYVLGQLLFHVYVDNIDGILLRTIGLFADDNSLVDTMNRTHIIEITLNHDWDMVPQMVQTMDSNV